MFFTRNEWKEFFFWLALAIVFALICQFAKSDGSDLSDYMEKNNLRIPVSLEKKLDEIGLYPAFGMNGEDSNFVSCFTIFYIHKKDINNIPELEELNIIDPSKTVLKVRIYTKKRKITLEFNTYEKKIWNAVEIGYKHCLIEMWEM